MEKAGKLGCATGGWGVARETRPRPLSDPNGMWTAAPLHALPRRENRREVAQDTVGRAPWQSFQGSDLLVADATAQIPLLQAAKALRTQLDLLGVHCPGEALMPRTERIQAEEASYEERSLIGSRLPPGFKVPMGKVFFWLCWAGLYPLGAHWRTFFPAFMGFDYQTARKCGVPRKLEIKFVFLRKKA